MASVQRYHLAFASDAVRVARSRPLRIAASVFTAMNRLTRGRFGIPSGAIDLDAVAVSFAAEGPVASAGGTIGDLEQDDDGLRLPIFDVGPETDRTILVAAVGDALRGAGLTGRRVVVRFDDGEERDAIPG